LYYEVEATDASTGESTTAKRWRLSKRMHFVADGLTAGVLYELTVRAMLSPTESSDALIHTTRIPASGLR